MQSACRFVVAVLAFVTAACDGGAVVVMPSSSASAPPATATITASVAPQTPAFVGFGCQIGARVAFPFDIAITASTTVDLDSLSVEMIDGTNLSGASVTVPRAEISNRFGGTLVAGGTTRVFTVRPDAVCGAGPWRSVSAAIACRDGSGRLHVITAAATLH
jgi:hypothetical protein